MHADTLAEIPKEFCDDVARLWPMYYEQIKRSAKRERAKIQPFGTLNTTALVNEAYLKLGSDPTFQSREHFLRTSVVVMRYILVDRVRAQVAAKRGGGDQRVPLTTAEDERLVVENDTEVLSLHQSMLRLAADSPRLAEVAECHYFGGYTYEEIGEVLGISTRTARRDLQMAKAWLAEDMGLLG